MILGEGSGASWEGQTRTHLRGGRGRSGLESSETWHVANEDSPTGSVAATRPAVSRLTKPRLFSDSTGPTAPYLLDSRLRLGRNFQSTQVDFFCLFFSFQNYILQRIKKHEVLLFYHVNIQCASYKLVTFIWTSLRVNPAHMKSALLEMTIKMLDITYHPHHFDVSLECQMTLCLHLLPRVRRSPWPDFTKARDDNDLIQVNDVT